MLDDSEYSNGTWYDDHFERRRVEEAKRNEDTFRSMRAARAEYQRRVALDPSIAIGPPRPQPGFVDTLREPAVACALVIVCLSLLVMVFNDELAGLYVWFVTR